MNNVAQTRRFSLLSLVLLITSIGAMAGWIGALREANLARRETLQLRRELEGYRAELGELTVVDKTRIHAIGLRRDPQDHNRWKWRVFVPPELPARLVLETTQIQHVELPAGELLIEAQLSQRDHNPRNHDHREQPLWSLNIALDGAPAIGAALPNFTSDTQLSIERYVGPNDRSVWEQFERPVLIEARNEPTVGNDEQVRSKPVRFTIWIEVP